MRFVICFFFLVTVQVVDRTTIVTTTNRHGLDLLCWRCFDREHGDDIDAIEGHHELMLGCAQCSGNCK